MSIVDKIIDNVSIRVFRSWLVVVSLLSGLVMMILMAASFVADGQR